MTRTRNTSFGGTTPPDVDIDVPSYTTVFREAVQDANLLYDKCTGENGIATDQVIKKDGYVGAGTVKSGPPMRRPVIAQVLLPVHFVDNDQRFGRSMSMAEADYDVHGGRAYILAVPFYAPTGEDSYWIDVALSQPFGSDPEYELRDSSWNIHQQGPLTQQSSGPNIVDEVWSGVLQSLTPGQYYLLIRATIGWEGGYLSGWRVYPKRTRDASAPTYPTATYTPFPVGNGSGTKTFETIHDEMIDDNLPVAGWLVTTLNRNVNWLLEHVTGAPVPGNSDRSNMPWMRHGAATFSGDGPVQFVLTTEAFGPIKLDRTFMINSAGTRGCLSWAPLIPRTYDTTRRTAHRIDIYAPNLATNNTLMCRVLATTDGKGDITQWDLRVSDGTNNSATDNFASIGGGFYTAAVNVGVALSNPQDLNTLYLQFHRSATGTGQHGEIAILGYQLYYTGS